MTSSSGFQYTSQILWGGSLLLLGTILLLDNLEIVQLGSIWRYWPFLIVAVGVGKFLQASDPPERRSAAWWVFLGLWLYISIFKVFGFGFQDSWPFLLIAWGIGMVWKSLDDRRASSQKEQPYEQI